MTTKSWEEVVVLAKEFIDVMSPDVLFNKPFNNTMDCIVTTDVNEAFNYSADQNDDFPYWIDVTTAYGNFPESFEYPDDIRLELDGNKYFNIENKDFSGVDEGWGMLSTYSTVMPMTISHQDGRKYYKHISMVACHVAGLIFLQRVKQLIVSLLVALKLNQSQYRFLYTVCRHENN